MNSNPSGWRKSWVSFKAYYLHQFVSLFWMLGAVGVGLYLRENIEWLKNAIEFPLMALLSGIFGIMIPNLSQFGKAGRVLTKSDNARINLLVGVGVIVVILVLGNLLISQFI
jgi:hypothetical protein